MCLFYMFFFHDTATTGIYTLSLHDALPISFLGTPKLLMCLFITLAKSWVPVIGRIHHAGAPRRVDRKRTRLNSSHTVISYAVFCLKKKKLHQLIILSRILSPRQLRLTI